jgi:hypothetical protein
VSYNHHSVQEKKRRGSVPDGDAQQETVASAPEGNSAERSTGPLGRQEALQAALDSAIAEELARNPPAGTYDPALCASSVIKDLTEKDPKQWASIQALINLQFITDRAQRQLRRNIKAEAKSDARQGILALPEFHLVSPWVKVEGVVTPLKQVTVEQHRESVKERASRIKTMAYPRWSKERTAQEKAALKQERSLDRKVAPLTAGDGEMAMGQGMELLQEQRDKPATKQRAKAAKQGGKTGGRGRKRST